MAEKPTSPDLLERVQRYGDALAARDFDSLTSLYASDAVASFGMFGRVEGRAAIRKFFEDFTTRPAPTVYARACAPPRPSPASTTSS